MGIVKLFICCAKEAWRYYFVDLDKRLEELADRMKESYDARL